MLGYLKKFFAPRIKVGSTIRAKDDLNYHLSDWPLPHGTFDKVRKGDVTTVLKVCSKLNGHRHYLVSWLNDGQHRHIVAAHKIELIA